MGKERFAGSSRCCLSSTVGDPGTIGASVGTDLGGARTGQIAIRLEF